VEPSKKHPEIEAFLNEIFGIEREAFIKNNKCVSCEEEVRSPSFRTMLGITEFAISGLCQNCQDEVFEEVPD